MSKPGQPFHYFVDLWALIPDGEPVARATSDLLPVRWNDRPAMLKIAKLPEEQRGNSFMNQWRGKGAAQVFACEGRAILMERAMGERSLAAMARQSCDDEASRILCFTAAKLHAAISPDTPDAVPLAFWFRELEPAALRWGGVLSAAHKTSRALLRAPQDVSVLHGDIHHENVLDFGERGWLAIDPKGLRGERGFDLANVFCNPDLAVAAQPGRLARQATVVAAAARLDRRRLLQWILAYAGLSAAWSLSDPREDPTIALLVAESAGRELEIHGL